MYSHLLKAFFSMVILIPLISFSQNERIFYGTVEDQGNTPLIGAEILNEKDSVVAISDSLGSFVVKLKIPVTLYAKHELDVSDKMKVKKKQGNALTFFIDKKIQLMDEVFVTRGNTQTIFDENSVNIIDYIPLKEHVLTLKKYKGEYFLGYDHYGEEGESFVLDIKPKGLYIDCLDNYYVVTKDSAYHISIKNDGLHYMNILTNYDFTQRLKKCVVKTDDYLITEDMHSFNTGYNLTYFKKDTNFIVYSFLDSVRLEYLVNASYHNYKYRMERYGAEGQALLLQLKKELEEKYNMKIHDVRVLNERVRGAKYRSYAFGQNGYKNNGTERVETRNQTYSSYSMAPILLYRSKVFTFKLKKGFVVINSTNNTSTVYDDNGEKVKESNLAIQGKFRYVFQDGSSKNLYFLMKEDGNNKVYGYNPLTGEVIYAKNFKTFPNTSNVKVNDGWLYFKYLKNNYYDIKRVRLPDFEE